MMMLIIELSFVKASCNDMDLKVQGLVGGNKMKKGTRKGRNRKERRKESSE
jgi:hypothetical protein